ncbi:hypothetical protein [Enterobacter mori]|uniref:hypothetical protein n=1 Tax=Enterobacter mori TaxID=539813 RepID=UPI003B83F2F1
MASEKNEQPLGVALGSLCAIIFLALIVANSTKKPVMDITQSQSMTANANPDELKQMKAEETILNYISSELEKNKPFDDHDTNNAINTLNH